METIEPKEQLSGLVAFVAVAEAEGFSAAARRIGVTKGTVSKRVAALEDRLGARLFNRTTRRLSLTEVGIAFHARCVRILADLEEAERAVTELHATPRGRLRLSAPMSFGVRHLATAIPEFMARYPELAIDLELNDRRIDIVDEGFDAAVRIASLEDSSLIARRVAPSRRVVCAAPAYWAKHGVPTHPAQLADHNCMRYSYLQTQGEWPFSGPDGPITVSIDGNYTANNGDALVTAAVAGHGVAFAPTFMAGDFIRNGQLVPALRGYEPPAQGVFVIWPHNRHLSAKVRLFVDFLASHFGHEPYWDAAIFE